MPRAHLAVLGALLLAGVLIAAFWLASSERRFAATNSVAPRAVTAGLGSGEELCLEDIWMPAGANAFRLWLATPGAPVRATVSLGRETAAREVRGSDPRPVDFAVTPRQSGAPVRACVRGEGLALAGTSGPNYDGQTGVTIDGRPHAGRVAAWFLEPQETPLASTLAGAARRAALFKPGWVGPWSFPVLFALSLGLCALGMWALLRAPPRRALVIVGVAAFGNAAVWSLLTPAFQGPDEEQHYAYAEYLAQARALPARSSASPRSLVSSDQAAALGGINHGSVIQFPQTRPPWRSADEAQWRALARAKPPRDDGGGPTGAATHGPVYYAPVALAVELGGDPFERLWLMRLVSALLGALTAVLVALTLRELLPTRPWAWSAAGLLVGFQPMFGFLAGTVNPDMGANLAGAALLYLGARALTRGLTPALGAGIAATFALGVLAKETMLGLAPVAAIPFLWALRRRPAAVAGILAAGLFAVIAVTLTDAVPVPESSPFSGNVGLGQTGSWLWQLVLPPLPFMTDLYTGPGLVPAWSIYVERVWGAFGWISVLFPQWVFWLCAIATAALAGLAGRAVALHPGALRRRAPQAALLGVAIATMALTAHLSFIPGAATESALEQGRYLFPAIGAAATVAIVACLGAGERRAPVVATGLVGAMMLLTLAGQFLVFTSFYA